MSFWAAAKTAWFLGNEYGGAWEAAKQALDEGRPLTTIIEAFARQTEGKLDDEAVAILIAGIAQGIGLLQHAALRCGQFAEAIEEHAPVYLLRCKQLTLFLRVKVPEILEALDTFATMLAGKSEQLRSLASVVGVLCVRLVMRLEKLRA